MGRNQKNIIEKPLNKIIIGKLLQKSLQRKELYVLVNNDLINLKDDKISSIGNINTHLEVLKQKGYVYAKGNRRKQYHYLNFDLIHLHFVEKIFSLNDIYGFINNNPDNIKKTKRYLEYDCIKHSLREFLKYWAAKTEFNNRPFYYWFNLFCQSYQFSDDYNNNPNNMGLSFMQDSKSQKRYYKVWSKIIEPYYYWLQDLALNLDVETGFVSFFENQ